MTYFQLAAQDAEKNQPSTSGSSVPAANVGKSSKNSVDASTQKNDDQK